METMVFPLGKLTGRNAEKRPETRRNPLPLFFQNTLRLCLAKLREGAATLQIWKLILEGVNSWARHPKIWPYSLGSWESWDVWVAGTLVSWEAGGNSIPLDLAGIGWIWHYYRCLGGQLAAWLMGLTQKCRRAAIAAPNTSLKFKI